MTATWRILEGDCRDMLAGLDAGSVQTCVTSPPYFGLRDYGTDGQIGLEPSPDGFVAALVGVFREVRRVLRDDGTVWCNLGDSYAGSWGNQGRKAERGTQRPVNGEMLTPVLDGRYPGVGRNTGAIPPGADYKAKDLLGIPWMVAFALRADGWYLRSDIIWSKPNPMPESVTDRPTKAHEYVFLLSKGPQYFYDAGAIREEQSGGAGERRGKAATMRTPKQATESGPRWGGNHGLATNYPPEFGRNKRSVWTVVTQPFAGSHFAVFPPKLIEPCILAGCPERACGVCGAPWTRVVEVERVERQSGGRSVRRADLDESRLSESSMMRTNAVPTSRTVGWEPSCSHDALTTPGVVLDPFAGAGTTGVVALRHNRSFIGIELNPEYVQLARDRIIGDAPLLNSVAEAA